MTGDGGVTLAQAGGPRGVNAQPDCRSGVPPHTCAGAGFAREWRGYDCREATVCPRCGQSQAEGVWRLGWAVVLWARLARVVSRRARPRSSMHHN